MNQTSLTFPGPGGARSASGATFSLDRQYRYRLWRVWDAALPRCAFIGCNPSKADELKDDHTITKEIGFATRWGFGAIDKANLFGLVSTDVRGLLRAPDPLGQDNDLLLRRVLADADRLVFAWGSHGPKVRALLRQRLEGLDLLGGDGWRRWIRPGCEVGTFGPNADGSPRHPLRLGYDTPWIPL